MMNRFTFFKNSNRVATLICLLGSSWLLAGQSLAQSGSEGTAALRINAGGAQVINALGTFAGDNNFSPSPGNTYTVTNEITGTEYDALYQTERAAMTGNGSFNYALPVANGQYKVVLHFAELYWNSVGQRVFDVAMEGNLVLDNYDILRKTGAPYTATTESVMVEVTDGNLNILFSALAQEGGVDRPKISAIEVIPEALPNLFPVAKAGPDKTITLPVNSVVLDGAASDADGTIRSYAWRQLSGPKTATFNNSAAAAPIISDLIAGTYMFALTVQDNRSAFSKADLVSITVMSDPNGSQELYTYRVNAGGGQVINSAGTFSPDIFFSALAQGQTYSSTSPIAGTQDDALYQTERSSAEDNGAFGYNFPVKNGQYKVVLHFAELYWNSVGQRVFDVTLEGGLVLDNFDIVKKAGANFTATTETFLVTVADGTLDLYLSGLAIKGGVNRPKISAIEVIPSPGNNLSPAANAGSNQAISLPVSSVVLKGSGSDTDGTISSYAWQQVSGPNAATFNDSHVAAPVVSGLVTGTYVFSLTVKDNKMALSAADQVVVTVNPDPNWALVAAAHRINAGGARVTNALGTFSADALFAPAPGYTYTSGNPIAGTDNDALYQTERASAIDNGSFSYALPVTSGKYKVVLHFAELYFNATGQRVFDVALEGALALDDYDIIEKTGATFTATTESFLVNVTDGNLDILFSALASEGGVNRPKISAIEVIPYEGTYAFPVAKAGADKTITLPENNLILDGRGTETHGRVDAFTWTQVSGPNTARFYPFMSAPSVTGLIPGTYVFSLTIVDDKLVISAPDQITVTVLPDPNVQVVAAAHRINAGGKQETNSIGTFAADAYFGPEQGITYSTTHTIAGTQDGAMYQTERTSSADNGTFSYAMPVSNGQYTVVLHFAELYWNSVGQRVFDVLLEGNLALDNYDIIKKAGAQYTATTESFTVAVTDGTLDLLFRALADKGGKNRPKVSAIEVIPNNLPVVMAGADQSLTLPANSITLTGAATDTDGTITAYTWTKLSGPALTLTGANTASLTASDLLVGSYVFRLKATDNGGAAGFDDVSVTVNPPASMEQKLVSFTLINADTEQDIKTLVTGETIDLASLPTRNLNIRANTDPIQVVSVKMALSGAQVKNTTEAGAPYALFGDVNGKYNAWVPAVGTYTLTATPYAGAWGSGKAGTPLSITFQVEDRATAARFAMATAAAQRLGKALMPFPNPTNDGRFQVTLPEAVEGELSYELITITGVSLAKGKRQLNQSASILNFDFSGQMQTAGMYFLKLEGNNLKTQLKLLRR